MRRLLAGAALAASLVVTLATPVAAITGNYYDDFDHDFVGLIAFYDADGVFQHRCTGELLSSSVVLTAGHCTDNGAGGVNASARIWFLQDVGGEFDGVSDPRTGYPNSCSGTLGDGLAGGWCSTGTEMYNFGFDNFAGFPEIHDVGVVILDTPVPMSAYASLASAGTVETLQTKRGIQDKTMRASGYGLSYRLIVPTRGNGKGNAITVSFRVRLQANLDFSNIRNQNTQGFTFQANGNGNNSGGTCNGDSGGPIFWPSTSNRIVAVTSWGILNAGCRGNGYYYRTDRTVVLDWLEDVIGPDQWGDIVIN